MKEVVVVMDCRTFWTVVARGEERAVFGEKWEEVMKPVFAGRLELNITQELSMEEDESDSQEGGQSSESSEENEVVVETVDEGNEDESE